MWAIFEPGKSHKFFCVLINLKDCVVSPKFLAASALRFAESMDNIALKVTMPGTLLFLSLSLSLSLYKYAPQKALLCRNKQFNGLVVLPKAWQMNNPAQLSYARHPGAVLKGACAFNFASRTFLRTFLPGINLYTSMGWWVWSGKRLKPPFSVCSLSWPLSFLKWQSSTFAHAVILLVARVLTVTIRIAQGSNSYTLWAFAQTASCSTAPK